MKNCTENRKLVVSPTCGTQDNCTAICVTRSPIMGIAYDECTAMTNGVVAGECFVHDGNEYKVLSDNKDGLLVGLAKGTWALIDRCGDDSLDEKYLPIPAKVAPNPSPTEFLQEVDATYGGENLQNIVSSKVITRADFTALGMRATDNAIRFIIRVSYKMKGNAFQPPYTTDVATGMLVEGDKSIFKTGWSGAVSDNLSFGSFLMKLDANDEIKINYTGYVNDLAADSAVLQVWGFDAVEFCMIP